MSKIVQIFATAVREKDESNKMAAENVKAVHITESILIVCFFHQSVTLKHTQNIENVQKHILQNTAVWAIKKRKKNAQQKEAIISH